MEEAKQTTIAEIKSGETVNPTFWKTLLYFEKLLNKTVDKVVYYGGSQTQTRSGQLFVVNWQALTK